VTERVIVLGAGPTLALECETLPEGRLRVTNTSTLVLEVRHLLGGERTPLPPGASTVMGVHDEIGSISRVHAHGGKVGLTVPDLAGAFVTVAERKALEGLHRWLHDAEGDGELVEAASDFHDEREADCPRLERELAVTAGARRRTGQVSTLARVAAALSICDGLVPEPSDPFHCAIRRVRAALSGFDDEPRTSPGETAPDAAKVVDAHLAAHRAKLEAAELGGAVAAEPAVDSHRPRMEPLPVGFTDAIMRHAIAGGESAELAAHFIVWAMRGAQMAWHTRQAHPGQIAAHARAISSKLDEPDRSAWLTGYRIVAPDGVATGAEPYAEPAPFVLTEAHRGYYRRELVYRAPEMLSAFDREIMAAVDAETRQSEASS
jgi:hypothetical protein